jgi:hypothetical protein
MATRFPSQNLPAVLGRVFYPATLLTIFLTLLVVQVFLGTRFAIFGLYALFGIGIGAAIYYGTDESNQAFTYRVDARLSRVAVYAVSALTVGIVAVTDQPLFVSFGLVVGYALVVRQVFAEVTPERLVPQLTALFLLSPIAKYLTAGMYVGHSDVIVHTGLVEDIMAGQSLEAISFASYYEFPGLHLVASAVGSLSGLNGYEGLMLTGLVTYVVLIPAVYLVVARITGHPELALYTAFAVSVLDGFSFYASYVFPQSIATMIVVVLAVVATLAWKESLKWPALLAAGFVAVALSFTHHLTQVLFVPMVGLAYFLYAVRGRTYARSAIFGRPMLILVFATALSLYRIVRTGMHTRLWAALVTIVEGGSRGGYTQRVTLEFGGATESASVVNALEWLGSLYGIYLVLLVAVFSIGVATFLHARDRPVAQVALFGTGVVAAVFVFETPISVASLGRIRFPWLFPFAFVLGVGVLQVRERLWTVNRSRVLVAMVVLLAAAGPLVAADDYYGLDPRPNTQTALSDSEVAEFSAYASHARAEGEPVTAFWLSQRLMTRYDVDGDRTARLEGRELILPEGHFVYRSAWSGHKVHFTVGEADGDGLYSNSLYVSGEWLDSRLGAGNKVYTAGGTGMLWDDEPQRFGALGVPGVDAEADVETQRRVERCNRRLVAALGDDASIADRAGPVCGA